MALEALALQTDLALLDLRLGQSQPLQRRPQQLQPPRQQQLLQQQRQPPLQRQLQPRLLHAEQLKIT